MTRGAHPPAAPIPRASHRYMPYRIPDFTQFRLQPRTRAELFSEGLVDLEPDSLNIDDWINTTAVESPPHEPLTDVDDNSCSSSAQDGNREKSPVQADALDVVHAILEQSVDDQDLCDDNHPDEPSADESILPNAQTTADEEASPAWVPENLPDDIFVESDKSPFKSRDEEDEPYIIRNENLEEYQPADFTMTATEFKFALFLSEFKLSRRAWTSLCEIIQTSPYEELLAMPKWKPTLMDKFNNQLPKCAMRRKTVKLDVAKLPNRASPTEDLVWLDMEHFISKLLISPLYRQHIYQGLGQLTRYVTEFWQTRAWGESIRTTSGNFVENKWGKEILPSDFVRFMCLDTACWCQRAIADDDYATTHRGRVTYCGLDKTGRFSDNHPITFIAPVYEPIDLPEEMEMEFERITESRQFVPRRPGVIELILVQGSEVLIPSAHIVDYVEDVYIDYQFDPKEEGDYVSPTSKGAVVRYIWNKVELQAKNKYSFIPARLTNPHRAELEIRLKSRAKWLRDFKSKPSISLPWKMFIDAFGLYRNMYRSMTGVYPLPAFYPDRIANRRSSVAPLTVGLYGMETSDLLNELSHIGYLALGHDMDIGRAQIHVCSFTICFVGDFPQMQDLSGCKDHKALQPCRFCMIPKSRRHDLEYNVIEFGRYHDEMISIREKVKNMRVGERNKKLKDFGLKEIPAVADAASSLAPGIDLLRGRPIDAAHSEFTSLVKTTQRILLDEIIAKKYHREFVQKFQKFPLPPHFHRIQSPTAHLDSWRMQECTEVSIVMPVLLHYWLLDTHIQPSFLTALQREIQDDKWLFVFADLENGYIRERQFMSDLTAVPAPEFDHRTFPLDMLARRRRLLSVREIVIVLFWNVARSNLLVFGRYPPQLTSKSFMNLVYRGRLSLQFIFHAAAHSCTLSPRMRRSNRAAGSIMHDDDNDRMSIVSDATNVSRVSGASDFPAGSVGNIGALPKGAKSLAYSKLKELPNIHQGLHLWEIAEQFGACRMVNTLLGEDQHKQSKAEVLSTNNRLVSETLIQRMNTRKSIGFGFAGAYEQTFPEVHDHFEEASRACPSLLQYIKGLCSVDDDDGDTDGKLRILGDKRHLRPLVALTMKRKFVISREDSLLNVDQPWKLDLKHEFVIYFMAAYEKDYGVLDTVNFGRHNLRWVGQLSFSTETSRRICVRVNDFIRTSYDMQLAKVDGIFTHRYNIDERAFLVVTFLETTEHDNRDPLLDCPIFKTGNNRLIIGLPGVLPSEYWIIQQQNGSYLSLPHDIYTL